MKRAAVAWCILNRVDAAGFPDTIEGVVTAKHQFAGYDPSHPVTDELRSLTVDVLQRWHSEQSGEVNVGRVLPKDYKFFWGDGWENYFTNEWKGADYWDWSMDNPYENCRRRANDEGKCQWHKEDCDRTIECMEWRAFPRT